MHLRRADSKPSQEPIPPKPSQTAEDYLERIHELIEEKGYARVVDIASSLDVKQASVTNMVQKLDELGYLNYQKYRGLVLTEEGHTIALAIQKRHEMLSRFFPFGIDAATQQSDIEGIEHHLSSKTMDMLTSLTDFLNSIPIPSRPFTVISHKGENRSMTLALKTSKLLVGPPRVRRLPHTHGILLAHSIS